MNKLELHFGVLCLTPQRPGTQLGKAADDLLTETALVGCRQLLSDYDLPHQILEQFQLSNPSCIALCYFWNKADWWVLRKVSSAPIYDRKNEANDKTIAVDTDETKRN